MKASESKPVIGISSCLMGESVRFDGGHKEDKWLRRDLDKFVDWYRVCPEVAMGLGVPRESMRLYRKSEKSHIRLVGSRSQTDFTSLVKGTVKELSEKVPLDLNGFVFKNKSPSCGLERVKVFNEKGIPFNNGTGFFARELVRKFPELPVIEEGKLNNLELREHFITRVFGHHAISILPAKVSAIQKFHEAYKFTIQAHDESSLRKLGPIAANSKKEKPTLVLQKYRKIFLSALSVPSSVKKRTNVIQHIYGFVKNEVSPNEKKSVLKNIEEYRLGNLPYVAVMVLIQHLIDKYEVSYIAGQNFLCPYPRELKLSHGI